MTEVPVNHLVHGMWGLMRIHKLLTALFFTFLFPLAVFAQPYTMTINGINLTNPPAQNSWYVTAAGAGAMNGTSQANAWAINAINWFTINPGDTIYTCGMIRSPLTIQKSGVIGYPIIIRGDCSGNAGTINGANIISSSWTSVGSNVYTTPVSTNINGMVMEDDSALIRVIWTGSSGSTITNIVSCQSSFSSKGCFSYDSTHGILYVLTVADDSPAGHTIEASYGQQFSRVIENNGYSNITIENLTVKDGGDYGIGEESGGVNNIVANCTIYNIYNWGIFSQNNTNMIVNGNTMHQDVWGGHLPQLSIAVGEVIRYNGNVGGSIYSNTISDSPAIGIDLRAGASGAQIYGNTIHDNNGTTTQYAGGIYLEDAQNNYVYGNLIYNWMVGLNISSEDGTPSSGNIVYNNIAFSSQNNGMILGASFNSWISSTNNSIYNNDILGTTSGGPALIIGPTVNDKFKNNIVFGQVQWYPSANESFTAGYFDYNTYAVSSWVSNTMGVQTFNQWQTYNSGDTNSSNPSPTNFLTNTFVNIGALNFQLQIGSVPVNAGTNLYSIFTTDYAGTTRPSTGPWDNGPYQNI